METSMRSAVFLFALFAAPSLAWCADQCTALIPSNGPYNILRTRSSQDVQLWVDDFVYHHQYKTHQEFVQAGLAIGTIVYGVPLQAAGTFSQDTIDKWVSDYQHRTQISYSSSERHEIDQWTVDKVLVEAVTACIAKLHAFGLQTEFNTADDCNYTVRVSFVPEILHQRQIPRVTKISTTGGSCEQWPTSGYMFKTPNEIPPKGQSLTCKRNRRDSLIVHLDTDIAGSSEDLVVPAMPALGDEPHDNGPTPHHFTYGPIHHQDPSISHPELGFVDPDRKVVLKVPITVATGTIDAVRWHCAGQSCGWTWQLNVDGLNTSTAIWVGKTNSADPSDFTFDVDYKEPSDYPSKHNAWIAERARTCSAVTTPPPQTAPWYCPWCK